MGFPGAGPAPRPRARRRRGLQLSVGRLPAERPQLISDARLPDRLPDDTVDLLAYRQLHSPILTRAPWTRRPVHDDDLSDLVIASCLERAPSTGNAMFRHPTGFEVEAKQDRIRDALEALRPLWPRGLSVAKLFPAGGDVHADLRLLHLHGLVDLRLPAADGDAPPPAPLNERERAWGGFATTRYHTRES